MAAFIEELIKLNDWKEDNGFEASIGPCDMYHSYGRHVPLLWYSLSDFKIKVPTSLTSKLVDLLLQQKHFSIGKFVPAT